MHMFNVIFIFVYNAEFGLRMQLSGRVLRHRALDSNSSISKEKKTELTHWYAMQLLHL